MCDAWRRVYPRGDARGGRRKVRGGHGDAILLEVVDQRGGELPPAKAAQRNSILTPLLALICLAGVSTLFAVVFYALKEPATKHRPLMP